MNMASSALSLRAFNLPTTKICILQRSVSLGLLQRLCGLRTVHYCRRRIQRRRQTPLYFARSNLGRLQ
jgi:hypothetical protein